MRTYVTRPARNENIHVGRFTTLIEWMQFLTLPPAEPRPTAS